MAENATQEQIVAVQGIKKFLLWRLLKDAATAAGAKIALQTEHETSSSKDSNATQTKDGVIRSNSSAEQEVTATVLLSTSDEVDRLKQAHEQDEIVELWDVIAEAPDTDGKYKATYYQSTISEISESAPTDDGVEVSLTFAVNGVGQRGRTSLTAAQEEVLQYLFVEATAGTTQAAAREALANAAEEEAAEAEAEGVDQV
ncbi:TPA: phage major tail protein, TP901-1 family [Streptococcus suis]